MNGKKGISLIILIITIIIIIILAGAIILSLNNTNIIVNANKAVYDEDRESLIDTYTMLTMDKFVANSTKDEPIGNIDISELYTKIGKDLGDNFKVENNNLLEKQEDGNYDIIAKFPNSASYTRTKSNSSFNNPYIPNDFDYVEGKWDTGLVIKNKIDGNEFVWIPVKNESEYKKRDFLGVNSGNTADDTTTIKDELKNVTTYGGFYIGRYEAGSKKVRTVSGEAKQEDLIIKPAVPVYNYIKYNQAKTLAEGLYTGKSDYVSGLITGMQWDTACMFLGKEYACDSTGKGNYSGKLENTAVNGYKIKNVYDMAGNAFEFTNEIYDTQHIIVRGGYYGYGASSNPAGHRVKMSVDATPSIIAFRVSLYIK